MLLIWVCWVGLSRLSAFSHYLSPACGLGLYQIISTCTQWHAHALVHLFLVANWAVLMELTVDFHSDACCLRYFLRNLIAFGVNGILTHCASSSLFLIDGNLIVVFHQLCDWTALMGVEMMLDVLKEWNDKCKPHSPCKPLTPAGSDFVFVETKAQFWFCSNFEPVK